MWISGNFSTGKSCSICRKFRLWSAHEVIKFLTSWSCQVCSLLLLLAVALSGWYGDGERLESKDSKENKANNLKPFCARNKHRSAGTSFKYEHFKSVHLPNSNQIIYHYCNKCSRVLVNVPSSALPASNTNTGTSWPLTGSTPFCYKMAMKTWLRWAWNW